MGVRSSDAALRHPLESCPPRSGAGPLAAAVTTDVVVRCRVRTPQQRSVGELRQNAAERTRQNELNRYAVEVKTAAHISQTREIRSVAPFEGETSQVEWRRSCAEPCHSIGDFIVSVSWLSTSSLIGSIKSAAISQSVGPSIDPRSAENHLLLPLVPGQLVHWTNLLLPLEPNGESPPF